AMVPWKETFEVLPAILVVGVSFSSMQFFWSNKMDSNLVDITAGLFSLFCTVIFLLFWKPKKIWRFDTDTVPAAAGAVSGGLPSVSGGSTDSPVHAVSGGSTDSPVHAHSAGATLKAWLPFLILSVFVFLWGYKPVKTWMNVHTTPGWSDLDSKG